MKSKKPLIIDNEGKVVEWYKVYPFKNRLSYAFNNGLFKRKKFLIFDMALIPTSRDIHINNVWKDITKRRNKKNPIIRLTK